MLDRVQQELLIAVTGGGVPPFTVSFGVAHSSEDTDLEDLCRVADAALFRAKREGRNRVVVDSLPSASDRQSKTMDPAAEANHEKP